MPCKTAVISSYPFQGAAPCPLKPGSGPPRQGVPANCLSSFLIHPPLNRSYYLNILKQKALRASHSCCTYSVRVLQLRKVLSPAFGYAQRRVRVGDFDSPFPKVGKAWADLCPALACWVCKLYNGLFLAVSSAKPMDVPWTYPVPHQQQPAQNASFALLHHPFT